MKSNPWLGLWKSRKVCILLVDALFSVLALCATEFVAPDRLEFSLQMLTYLQIAVAAVIGGIAYEDGQAKASGLHYSQMEAERESAEDEIAAGLGD